MKKSTKAKKFMTYAILPEVQEAIESIMKEEEKLNTIHKVINACILDRNRMREALRKEESDANKLFHEKMKLEDMVSRFSIVIEQMYKYTKTS